MAAVIPINKDEIVAATALGTSFDYLYFWGHRKSNDGALSKSCFSQWYEARFIIAGEKFLTAEHYMMMRKARLFGDEPAAALILKATTPNEAKSLGRKVKGFSEDRWLKQREEIVYTGNLAKFSQNFSLRTFLRATGNQILVEASPVDAIWGAGLAAEDPRATIPAEWPGLNLLGFALMRVRAALNTQS